MCHHPFFALFFLFGLFAFLRRRHRWGHGCHRWGRWGGGYGHHGGPGGGPWSSFGIVDWVLSDLHLTPDQDRVVRDMVKDVMGSGQQVKTAARAIRGKLADALRTDGFDESAAGDLLAQLDESLEAARKQTVDVLARLHQVLDPSQRARLAALLEGRMGFRPGVSL